MVMISNRQRDDIVRYLELMCEALPAQDAHTLDIKRLARNLASRLKDKQPMSDSCQRQKNKKSADIK